MAKETHGKILEAAREIFLEKGFAGASVSMIAKKAHVNQSLIYHHFESKQQLWQHVKNDFVKDHFPSDAFNIHAIFTLEHFVKEFVKTRFDFYFQNPEVIRMMNWQRLDPQLAELKGTSKATPNALKEAFIKLQNSGQIRKNIDPDMALLFIGNAITAPLYDGRQKFEEDRQFRVTYLDMLTSFLIRALQSTEPAPTNPGVRIRAY